MTKASILQPIVDMVPTVSLLQIVHAFIAMMRKQRPRMSFLNGLTVEL